MSLNDNGILDPSILREYDIRGIVGETLSPDDVRALGRGFGSIIFEKHGAASQVVVGYDGRLSSPMLVSALIDGLLSSGVHVINTGLGPSPNALFCYI
mgnify:CR=1 FL=1